MRTIKFRCYDTVNKKWLWTGFENHVSETHEDKPQDIRKGYFWLTATWTENAEQVVWQQFTGLKDKNGKDIFEGDIFRIEEDTDTVDRVIYVVITWVQEWCMFATLRVEDEYPAYLNEGIEALDEPMFWTYTLEDTNSRKHFLCGNIYENPELLTQPAQQ